MPDRLDKVTIALSRRDIVIDWDTRQALMARLLHVKTRARIRDTFQAVGATRPVELKPGQRATLLQVLDDWSAEGDSSAPMPEELFTLRDALDHGAGSDDPQLNKLATTLIQRRKLLDELESITLYVSRPSNG